MFHSLLVAFAAGIVRNDLRDDGVPVVLLDRGQMGKEFLIHSRNSEQAARFSEEFVAHALATGQWHALTGCLRGPVARCLSGHALTGSLFTAGVDWRSRGAVTPAKDQGA